MLTLPSAEQVAQLYLLKDWLGIGNEALI